MSLIFNIIIAQIIQYLSSKQFEVVHSGGPNDMGIDIRVLQVFARLIAEIGILERR